MSDDGQPFGTYPDVAHVAMPLRGGKLGLRAELARRFFDKHDAVPASQALADACTVLEGYATQERARPLHLRVAARAGAVYIDMADHDDRVIVITDGAWRIERAAPVVFRRTALTAPLPEPADHSDLDLLWRYVNVDDRDRPILLAFFVSALIQPDPPHVILGLLAEHGSAKSTTTRHLVSLVDPSIAPLRMSPRDIDNWATAANGRWVVAIDNMSDVSAWFSDALCRAATGDALPKRALYTDADLAVLRFRRCVILNGIDLGGLAGDLSDRLAPVDLKRITSALRRDESEMATGWERDRPAVLTGLLDLAAAVHLMLPNIQVPEGLPRMADYARVLKCVDTIQKTSG
ncbi:ATP-binding protein [Mycolicibacterium senegalense]|uniref:ATP-binding protein n=1 Tax=Mycolicibacterium TaxID=1866885 RepID=UPI003204CCA6